MLHNLSQKYSSHNSYIKCVYSTIKCISFELFHCVINLDVVLSFVVFNGFDIYRCIAKLESMRLFFSSIFYF